MYSIIRTKKHKSINSLRFRENHTYRKHPTPNADPEKQHRNKLLLGEEKYADSVDAALKKYVLTGNNIRKNGVLAIEYLLTASPEFFDEGPKHERDARLKEWCDLQVKFLKEKHGEKKFYACICTWTKKHHTLRHLSCRLIRAASSIASTFLGVVHSLESSKPNMLTITAIWA